MVNGYNPSLSASFILENNASIAISLNTTLRKQATNTKTTHILQHNIKQHRRVSFHPQRPRARPLARAKLVAIILRHHSIASLAPHARQSPRFVEFCPARRRGAAMLPGTLLLLLLLASTAAASGQPIAQLNASPTAPAPRNATDARDGEFFWEPWEAELLRCV